MSTIINDVLPKTQIIAGVAQTVFDASFTADVASSVIVYARADGVSADDATQVVISSDYVVTFVGSLRIVRVTFNNARTQLDIITIIRETLTDRQNLYTNTNFTPSMLNQDFGIDILTQQQNKLYRDEIGPKYNVSERLNQANPTVDLILPKLGEREAWRMNAAGTAIEVVTIPDGGFSPSAAQYILQVANGDLPNAQALGDLITGFMTSLNSTGVIINRVLTGTANSITITNGDGTGGNPVFSLAVDIIHTGSLRVDNIKINGNTITSEDTDGDVNITPNADGDLVLDGQKFPRAQGTVGQVIGLTGPNQLGYVTVATTELYGTKVGIQDQTYNYAVTTGPANIYVASFTPAVLAYADGQRFSMKISTSNTGSSTVNIDGLGPIDIVNTDGTDLIRGNLLANEIFNFIYNGTEGKFEVDNPESPAIYAQSFYNGAFIDQPVVTVASDGATITLSLANGGSDLTMLFSSGIHELDVTPTLTIALTAGTDSALVKNYIYILESAPTVLDSSTTEFPSAEHVAIATVVCQSAASFQTYGARSFHQWNDTTLQANDQGHMTDINHWIRHQPATWKLGVVLTPTVGASTFDIATTTGEILQLHHHDFPAFDTSAGSSIYMVNDSVAAYARLTSLTAALTDANGVSMSNKRYNLVIFGVVSQDTGDCQVYGLLPTASYNSDQSAIDDTDRTAVYSIPIDFRGTGFLISRLAIRHVSSGNTWSLLHQEDLRSLTPGTATGSGTGGIDKLFDDPDPKLANDLDMNGKGLKAADGNELVEYGEVGSAVNHLKISNAITGAGPILEAVGDSTDAPVIIQTKGASSVWVKAGAGTAGGVRHFEDSDNGINSVGQHAPLSVTAAYDLIFPAAAPAVNGSSLSYTTAGVGSWVEVRSGTWAPLLYQAGAEITDATYNATFTTGWFSVVNDIIHFGCTFRLTAKGTVVAANALQISLPFTVGAAPIYRGSATIYCHGSTGINMVSNFVGGIGVLLQSTGNTMSFGIMNTGAGTIQSVDMEDIPANFYCQIVGSFRV